MFDLDDGWSVTAYKVDTSEHMVGEFRPGNIGAWKLIKPETQQIWPPQRVARRKPGGDSDDEDDDDSGIVLLVSHVTLSRRLVLWVVVCGASLRMVV